MLYTTSFTGADSAAWPTGWTARVGTGGVVDLQSNTGRVLAPATGSYLGARADYTAAGQLGDSEITGTVAGIGEAEQYVAISLNSDGGQSQGAYWQTGANSYSLWLNYAGTGSTIAIVRDTGTTETTLTTSATRTLTGATRYGFRFRRQGQVLSARVWDVATTEPTAWDLTSTLTGTPLTGWPALGVENGDTAASRQFKFDDVTISDFVAPTGDWNGSTAWNAAAAWGADSSTTTGSGTASLTASVALTASRTPAVPAAAPLTATTALTAAGTAKPTQSTALAATVALTSTATVTQSRAAALTASVALATISAATSAGTVPLAPSVALAAAGTPATGTTASLAPTVGLAATPAVKPATAVTFGPSVSLTAGGIPAPAVAVTLAPTVGLTAGGTAISAGTEVAPLAATVTLTSSGAARPAVQPALTTTVALTAAPQPAVVVTALLTVTANLTGTAPAARTSTVAPLAAAAQLTAAAPIPVVTGLALFTVAVRLTATSTGNTPEVGYYAGRSFTHAYLGAVLITGMIRGGATIPVG